MAIDAIVFPQTRFSCCYDQRSEVRNCRKKGFLTIIYELARCSLHILTQLLQLIISELVVVTILAAL